MKYITLLIVLMLSQSLTDNLCQAKENKELEAHKIKTARMLADLKQRKDILVLKAMQDAMAILDGRFDKVQLLEARNMLRLAGELDPDNKDIKFIQHMLRIKIDKLEKYNYNRVALALKKQIIVDFEEHRLEAVIDYLSNISQQNFYTDWSRLLNNAGIERDVLINLRMRGLTVEQILNMVLEQASLMTGELEPIGWSIKDGIVNISTEAYLGKK